LSQRTELRRQTVDVQGERDDVTWCTDSGPKTKLTLVVRHT